MEQLEKKQILKSIKSVNKQEAKTKAIQRKLQGTSCGCKITNKSFNPKLNIAAKKPTAKSKSTSTTYDWVDKKGVRHTDKYTKPVAQHNGLPVFGKMPKGYVKVKGATAAKCGTVGIVNRGASLFDKSKPAVKSAWLITDKKFKQGGKTK